MEDTVHDAVILRNEETEDTSKQTRHEKNTPTSVLHAGVIFYPKELVDTDNWSTFENKDHMLH